MLDCDWSSDVCSSDLDWVGYEVQPLMDAFAAEFGIRVGYQGIGAQELFVDDIRGKGSCDVYNIGNELIPALIRDGLLATLDYRHIPNFKNIAANFRDLTFDPQNRHSVPFRWGTIGLLIRTDLVTGPVRRWTDMVNAGRIALWDMPRNAVPVALKAAGLSANTESPAELAAMRGFLLKHRDQILVWPASEASIAPALIEGRAAMAFGWSFDAQVAGKAEPRIRWLLPEDGAILWNESLVIRAGSPRKAAAEAFINFVLRPEMSARVSNVLRTATTNEAARPFLDREVRDDPMVFPGERDLQHAEVILPIAEEAERLYLEHWQAFKMGNP
jgi:spermidine/putrescine transport system substrate-binding protein